MKFAWTFILCLLVIQYAGAFKDLFGPPREDKPSLLDILKKPKIPGVNIQLGSQFGGGSFGFGFGFGGQFLPSVTGVNYPPKETVNGRPDYPEVTWDEKKKEKVGPRPNWGEEKDYHKPGSHDEGKDEYPKPGSYDKDYPKPGSYDDEEEEKYTKPGSLKENEEYPKRGEKDSLPDWEDIGEKDPKSENMKDADFFGEGLIQPRFKERRNKRYIESRIIHVPLLFQSNGKPYQVKIKSPNSLMKGNEKD